MRTTIYSFGLAILFISVSCTQDSGSEYLWVDAEKSIQFQYDPFFKKNPKPISDLVPKNGNTCFVSGEDPNFQIQLCISKERISEFLQIFSAWKDGALVSEVGSVLSDGSEYRIGTYPFSEIKKKVEGSKFALIGDRQLKSLIAREVVWDRARFNLKNHFKTFSIFFLSNGTSFLVVSPSEGSEIYLGISFKATNLQKEIQILIRAKNQIGSENCLTSLPIITEIFGETNSSIGRWIEIYNPNTFSICEEGLELSLFENKVSLPITTGFISPYETRIYAEDSASLERISLSGLKWGDLKKSGKIYLARVDQSFEFHLPGAGYLFGETYYSWKGTSFSHCETTSKFCMDPGENGTSTSASDFACDPNDFEIEELNPNGLLYKGIFQDDWKYLDLIYKGRKICDPSSLRMRWGKNIFPIKSSNRIAEGEILSVGNLPFLLGNPLYSFSNIKSVAVIDIVSLSNSNGKEKVLWDGIFRTSKGIPTKIILEKTNGETVSICFRNGKPFLHPYTAADPDTNLTSYSGIEIFSENPRTSIGRTFCSKTEIPNKVYFSEVSWMGSYQGIEPISKDRFIEFASVTENSPDSAYLEIIQGNGSIVSILLPLEKEGLTLLSSGKAICFPQTEFWQDTSFSLPSSGSNLLRVFDPYTGEFWDEFSYSSSGPGINDTRNKIRKSAYSKLVSDVRVWSVSSYAGRPVRDPNCALTDAHPGILE